MQGLSSKFFIAECILPTYQLSLIINRIELTPPTPSNQRRFTMSSNVNSLMSTFKNAPEEQGDEVIKKALVQAVGNVNKMDEMIKTLNQEYDINQIFKVYYKNFA